MKENIIDIGKCISDKIKTRYANMNEKEFGSSNMVVDAYYPSYVINSLRRSNTNNSLSNRACAISPFIANELGIYQIGIDDLTRMLGYKKNDLKLIIDQIKKKNLNLVLLGLGGTGMNFMHWCTEIANFTNTINIFDSISIFEDDNLDLTNIFRFPQIVGNRNILSSHSISKLYLIDDLNILSKTKINKIPRYFNKYEAHHFIASNTIFYGAPDIETREWFYNIPEPGQQYAFVSGTHGNDDCQLYIKPAQNSNIQVESYGMINLSVFFMNQLKLTIEFLKLLASNEDLFVSKLVMEYSFAKEYTNGNIGRAGLNRTYNFPIQTNLVLNDEDTIVEDLIVETTIENELLEIETYTIQS